jgi:rRNA maturation endonuclease Nob1
MKFTTECGECNRVIKLDYDEGDATPAFCPFCGSDLEHSDTSTYEEVGAPDDFRETDDVDGW